ncbi:YcxB family protein [Paenisporosarcina indica]|uniref:YcxB family protein n=1 Tax=Paenisporosarcina indica TaxID=650093 RepID=UPI00094F6F5E|nr:YcxB family protein [Paenisporosarcina indica]
MEISYNLTEDDYISFNLYHMNNSKTGIRALRIQRFLLPVFIIALSYFMTLILDTSLSAMLVTSLLFSIVWIIFYPKYFTRTIAKNVKKMLKEGDNKGILGDQHMSIKEDGIVVTTKFGETKVSWEGLKTLKEDDNNFYLYVGAMNAYLIPKRQIAVSNELRTYINSKIEYN